MDNLSYILQTTYTLTDLKHRVRLLGNYFENKLFSDNQKFIGEQSASDANWIKSLSEDFLNQFNKANLNQILQDLDDQLKKITPLIVYIPFTATQDQIQEIGSYARKLFNQNLVLEIKLDPSLIGGAALVLKGVYKDYSIKASVQAKREEILVGFRKYVH